MVRTPMILLLMAPVLALPPAPAARADDPKSNSWLTPGLLKKGLGLISKVGLIRADIDFRPTVNLDFRPSANVGPVSLFGPGVVNTGPSRSDLEALEQQRQDADARLADARNRIERDKLEVLRAQLAVQVEQARTAHDHLEHARGMFEYQKRRDESLLRRLEYPLRPDKLIVVVADMSDGGTGEGVQVADEVANALTELRTRCGLDFEILVGEVRPGLVIRNQHMARDVGQHFPKGSCYAVVWGTLSPRTVGKFRPHVTCVMKVSDDRGVSDTYTIDLAAQDLPLGKDDEAARRGRHEELIAFTCAVIPGCYAAYELSRERTPDFARLTDYLGKGPEAERFTRDLAPLRKWPDARKGRFEYLSRMSRVGRDAVTVNGRVVEADVEYPQVVLNTRDNGVMTLITEPNSHKPQLFDVPNGAGKCVVYIDTTETTWRQFIPFYNSTPVKSREGGGRPWLKFEPAFTNLKLGEDGGPVNGLLAPIVPADLSRPVYNVSYQAAVAYCRKMGKELPRKAEWQAAARGPGGKFPWGESAHPNALCVSKSTAEQPFPVQPAGRFASDRSAIGCLDMAGNVAEWCDDIVDLQEGTRVVCGGSFEDDDPSAFEIARTRAEFQSSHLRRVGFRGVVRIPVDPVK